MTLPEVLPLVFDSNARITRRVWANRAIYCLLEQGQLCIRGFNKQGDTMAHPWTITESDWFGEDWEVVDA